MNIKSDIISPLTGGALELCTKPASVEYRGETIAFEKSYYRCVDTGFEFEDEYLENKNLKTMYDTYRRRHGIPLAEELTQMRLRYGLPSSAMSIILGLGENQYSLYEDGAVPSVSVGNLLALAMERDNMEILLHSAKNCFSEKLYNKYWNSFEKATRQNAKYKIYFEDYLGCDNEDISRYPANTIRMNESQSLTKTEAYNKPVFNYAL